MTNLDTRITDAMHRIEELYIETEGKCYVSFSGGKDSTVLLALIKMCEGILTIPKNGIQAVYSNTGIELGVTVDFVKWCRDSGWYPNIIIVRPEVSFDWVIKNKGKPMLSKVKSHLIRQYHVGKRTKALEDSLLSKGTQTNAPTWRTRIADKDIHILHERFPIIPSDACCEKLKKDALKQYKKNTMSYGAIIGIRSNEGGARMIDMLGRVKNGGKLCTVSTKDGIKKYPIIDWSDDDIEEFIQKYDVPLSEAYTKYGFDRTGCMACPYSKHVDNDLKYLYYHEPNRYKASMHWLKDVYIAQNVVLPFDKAYERERERMWHEVYEPMRQEMLRKYRPHSRLIKEGEQMTIFDYLGEEE